MIQLAEKHPLVKIYDFLADSLIFDLHSTLETVSKLNIMYERGWVYAAHLGDEVVAAAGAFRIKEWKSEYLTQLPEKEEGDILYIDFFACSAGNSSAPLKLLKEFLRENPSVTSVLYSKKGWEDDSSRFKSFSRKEFSGLLDETRLIFPPSKFSIYPPALIAASSVLEN